MTTGKTLIETLTNLKTWYVSLTPEGYLLSASTTYPKGSHIGRYVYTVQATGKGEAVSDAKTRRSANEPSDTPHGLR